MKRILLVILFYLSSTSIFSQVTTFDGDSNTLVGGKYLFKETKVFPEVDATDTTSEIPELYVYKGDYVEIITVENDIIYYKKQYADESDITTYALKKADFFFYTKQLFSIYKGAEVGVYTIPFRLRGKGDKFDFESNLSLQTNVIFGFGNRNSQNSFIDLSAGVGLSSINLNENNSTVAENRTASALTWSLGAVLKPAKNVNFGVFIGADYLRADDRKVNWDYNKKMWVGLGVNISFNKLETDEPATHITESQEQQAKTNIIKEKMRLAALQ